MLLELQESYSNPAKLQRDEDLAPKMDSLRSNFDEELGALEYVEKLFEVVVAEEHPFHLLDAKTENNKKKSCTERDSLYVGTK